ncbi:accessory factor UbiK family protein [Qingshengfaniella alkalisoli]|uniref:Accessory factor UbiK family protein n=1 Tax=Qingshengfaniella alkalisoli TaxID=2599296 RepID=A0A5B8I594_9RHOB|nr:accessory factor UbiK family protein [Qingshengfaniella alkalisoli]QDY68459.1 accessory factor UbiK family protein [Qingshengfaniella alkalisoli]
MQSRNKIIDDLSQLMTNAVGVAQGAKGEVETVLRSRLERWLAEQDFVTRDEFDAVKAMAQRAREENDALSKRLELLETKLSE